MRARWVVCTVVAGLCLVGWGEAAQAPASPAPGDSEPLAAYADVLNLHAPSDSSTGSAFNVFFDLGSWHGYALQALPEQSLGFVGPLPLTDKRGWEAGAFARLELSDAGSGQSIRPQAGSIRSSALPGRLVQFAQFNGLRANLTLIFTDADTTLVRVQLRATRARRVRLTFSGATKTGFRTVLLGPPSRAMPTGEASGYRISLQDPLTLAAGSASTLYLLQSARDESDATQPALPRSPELLFAANVRRWEGYLSSTLSSHKAPLKEVRYQRVAVKAIETLLANWRHARGDLHHDGVFPSYSNPDYHGFWAWDSWKHALALAQIDPELARNQIRAMFDYQAESGMLPDVIYPDRSQNNWRDTKPPLAALAVWEIYLQSHDLTFVREMFPKLLRYHRWWYADRSHAQDGLAEYGSTDGTLIAAAWESGMDNAARFDHTRMLRNGANAWSMDQQSVDLNCYLYIEKQRLAQMAGLLGEPAVAAQLKTQAAQLGKQIASLFYDVRAGYFRDIGWQHDHFIGGPAPESWMPLWAQVATPSQAASVSALMLSADKFATYLPFPTLAADDPEFSARKGYWRGPVWIDQAYLGVRALENYGRQSQADTLRAQLFEHAAGLTSDAPIYENYDPQTGAALNAPNFSWSAGYFLLLLLGDASGD